MYGYLKRDRRLEWFVAAFTAFWGAVLLLPPESLAASASYRVMLENAPEPVWGMAALFVGGLHMAALRINGMAAWTPFVRAYAAAMNAIVFSVMAAGCALVDTSAGAVIQHFGMVCAAVWVFREAVRDSMRVWVNCRVREAISGWMSGRMGGRHGG